MTGVREQREAAFWPLWRRWHDEPRDFLPLLLDAFDEIDRQARASWRYKAGGVIYEAADVTIYAAGSVVIHAGTAELDDLRERLEISEQENIDLGALVQQQANELRKRAGLKSSPAPAPIAAVATPKPAARRRTAK